jgi:hypothetical protein
MGGVLGRRYKDKSAVGVAALVMPGLFGGILFKLSWVGKWIVIDSLALIVPHNSLKQVKKP